MVPLLVKLDNEPDWLIFKTPLLTWIVPLLTSAAELRLILKAQLTLNVPWLFTCAFNSAWPVGPVTSRALITPPAPFTNVPLVTLSLANLPQPRYGTTSRVPLLVNP